MLEIKKYFLFVAGQTTPRKNKANIKGDIKCHKCGNRNTTLYKINNDIYICVKCIKEQ